MRERRRKFGPEFNEEAVKMVIDSPQPTAEVTREIHVNEGTLGNWVNRYRTKHAGQEPPPSMSGQTRLRELERENRRTEMDPASGFVSTQQRLEHGRRPSLPTDLLWSCLVTGMPLGAGLAVNAGFGWWPGLAALVIAAVPTGIVAYRTNPRQRRR
jgi:transposase